MLPGLSPIREAAMHAPVRTVAPAITPVSLSEAKAHLRVDGDDEDSLISALIEAATGHLDGYTGILGMALCEQTWRQSFDGIGRCLRLPIDPVISISSITTRNSDGQMSTVSSDDYALKVDELGAYVRFKDGYSPPSDLYQSAAVAVTYVAGYEDTEAVEAEPEEEPPVLAVPATSTVPAAIKAAILLLVGHWYANREASTIDGAVTLPIAVDALLAPYRRVRI